MRGAEWGTSDELSKESDRAFQPLEDKGRAFGPRPRRKGQDVYIWVVHRGEECARG